MKSSELFLLVLTASVAFVSLAAAADETFNNSATLKKTEAMNPNDAATSGSDLLSKKILAWRIILLLVTFPCLILFAVVFFCYVSIWKQQTLHGWIVLAMTSSLTFRFGILFLAELSILYLSWDVYNVTPWLCNTLGKVFCKGWKIPPF